MPRLRALANACASQGTIKVAPFASVESSSIQKGTGTVLGAKGWCSPSRN
jgi:hypothetical protein